MGKSLMIIDSTGSRMVALEDLDTDYLTLGQAMYSAAASMQTDKLNLPNWPRFASPEYLTLKEEIVGLTDAQKVLHCIDYLRS